MYKILVVEDDERLRINICEILENEGYQYNAASNGKKALELIKGFLPDLIISDIMMPEMDGFELLNHLLNDSETASIPFIFLTAKAEFENLRKGMQLGADDYLIKPFRIIDLIKAIAIRIKKKESQDAKVRYIKDSLTTKIPHELRTPLVPILGYSDLIEDENDIEQIKDMVRTIKKSGKKLHHKIEKFLLLKDLIIEQDVIKKSKHIDGFTEISSSLIYECIKKIDGGLNAEDRVKIDIETVSLSIKENYLETLVIELLENGLKFSPLNKSVSIQGMKQNSLYLLSVIDEGHGFTESEILKIGSFEKFGEDSFADSGFGIGLSIVKQLSGIYGFTLNIQSNPSQNTLCQLSFPLS